MTTSAITSASHPSSSRPSPLFISFSDSVAIIESTKLLLNKTDYLEESIVRGVCQHEWLGKLCAAARDADT